mmetsp:Transcript_7321/g.18509  ORF Transcript_7321/g.18509 Transcript_7321/m.18509 type:complete len:327 (+) Transcript_7321:82-1062(+)
MPLSSATPIRFVCCDKQCAPYVRILESESVMRLIDVYELESEDWRCLREEYKIPLGWKIFLCNLASSAFAYDGQQVLTSLDAGVQKQKAKPGQMDAVPEPPAPTSTPFPPAPTSAPFPPAPPVPLLNSLNKKPILGKNPVKALNLGKNVRIDKKQEMMQAHQDSVLRKKFQDEKNAHLAGENARLQALGMTGGDSKGPEGPDRNTGQIEIEIVEAQNLMAADLNGKSDPYVVVKLLESGKVVAKQQTPVIKKTLDPVWRHTMVFDVVNPELALFQFDVFDKDLVGSDEIGKISYSANQLDLTKDTDIWLTLQRVDTGKLHVVFRPK